MWNWLRDAWRWLWRDSAMAPHDPETCYADHCPTCCPCRVCEDIRTWMSGGGW